MTFLVETCYREYKYCFKSLRIPYRRTLKNITIINLYAYVDVRKNKKLEQGIALTQWKNKGLNEFAHGCQIVVYVWWCENNETWARLNESIGINIG